MSEPGSSAPTECEENDSSSTTKPLAKMQDALQVFREQWQKELGNPQNLGKDHVSNKELDTSRIEINEEKAKVLFHKGIEYEQKGKVYEAMQYYRKAIQIVPDIENKIFDNTEPKSANLPTYKKSKNREPIKQRDNADDFTDDLFSYLQSKDSESNPFCKPFKEQTATHFSNLPTEIILYILKWVVSNDLDLRSLEQCSSVCTGLYLLSRDTEIWRLACIRIWGLNSVSLNNTPYSSWRQMFIERSHLRYNGCYISKTTYLRHGENSFQDQFYRPWHLIEYYRYIRFFPDGNVLMLTTPDEPSQMITHLKSGSSRHEAVMFGHYRLQDDHVILVVKRPHKSAIASRQKKRNDTGIDTGEQTFQLEFQINSPLKRRFAQLIWYGYKVFTVYKNGNENQNEFDLMGSKYPPFWFSRVKSYHAESDSPLT